MHTQIALAQSTRGFTPTGNMTASRFGHTATLLTDGRVLIAGGGGFAADGPGASAEIYDPSTGTFSATGRMAVARTGHSATLLADGRVFIAGGQSAEIYDPSTGVFTPAGEAPGGHLFTATLLADGNVLVLVGLPGITLCAPNWRAALFDPSTLTFSATANQPGTINLLNATLLSDGRVFFDYAINMVDLVKGIVNSGPGLLYDPSTRTFTPVGDVPPDPEAVALCVYSYSNTATLLTSGDVLLAGGGNSDAAFARSTLYDPAVDTLRPTSDMAEGRYGHTATLLSDGTVLIAGGEVTFAPADGSYGGATYNAEIYDSASGAFRLAGRMGVARSGHTATLLSDGRVLIAGGVNTGVGLTSAELYNPPLF